MNLGMRGTSFLSPGHAEHPVASFPKPVNDERRGRKHASWLESMANNVLLESMACGTLVMPNREGGVPEYVPGEFNAVIPAGADADNRAGRLIQFEKNRKCPEKWQSWARNWAKGLDWKIITEDYRTMYQELDWGS